MSSTLSRSELAGLAIVAAALLLIYAPGLSNPPIFDDANLSDGDIFRNYGSLLVAKVRAFSYGSFVWVQSALGEGWWKQRLVNLAIHAAVVAALFGFYREILRHVEPVAEQLHHSIALVPAVGFFALNPVAVYAVAYLVQRSILLATLFVVLALWLVAAAASRRNPALYAVAIACYLLAMLSKEHAVLAPLAAIPVYVIVARPNRRRVALIGGLGLLILGGAALVLLQRYGEIIGQPFDENSNLYLAQLAALAPGADRNAYGLSILNQAYLFFQYGLRWFLPSSLWLSINLRPPFPVSFTSLPQVLGIAGYLATLAGGAYLLVRYRDWRSLAGLSLLLPALLFATEFATVWVQDPFVLYRSYLWAIGIPGFLFIALHGVPGRTLLGIAAVAGALMVWQAVDRVLSMGSADRAWTDAIAKMPDDPRSVGRWFAYLNRGAARVENRQYNLAMGDFELSSRLGDMGAGVFNRGALYAANGEHVKALASFDEAERAGYKLYNLPFQRGLSLAATGRAREAYSEFNRAWNMQPPSPTRELVLFNMGRAGLQAGLLNEAVVSLQTLLYVEPANSDARFYLAMALVSLKNYADALAALEPVPQNPPSGRTHYARALANYGLQRREAALAEIDAAIGIGPDTPHLREWRSRIQAMK